MITWSFSAHHTEKRLNADYTLFFKRLKFALKANHLVYIVLRWCVSQISADSQQNLISPKHHCSGRFLLVIFLKEQKREGDK